MTRIGLLGDPHASLAPAMQALSIFHKQDVDAVWCTGDIAGYGSETDEVMKFLDDHNCRSVLGNHEIWYRDEHIEQASLQQTIHYINRMPLYIDEIIDGVRVYMVHASPPDLQERGIRLLDRSGNINERAVATWKQELHEYTFDVLIVGHTHQVYAEILGSILVINPGSCRYNNCCAVLTLPERQVEWFALSGKEILKSWNWSDQVTDRATDY